MNIAEAEAVAELAIERVTGRRLNRMELYSYAPDKKVCELAIKLAHDIQSGIPLQHLTRRQVFLEHEYEVGPEALIPRPETEGLVLRVINGLSDPEVGLEIGIGAGIVSVELLARFPKLVMVATDVSASALALAAKNAVQILGTDWDKRLLLVRVDPREDPASAALSAAIQFGFNKMDFLVSNPPYLDLSDEISASVLMSEPRESLFPLNGDPMVFYYSIARLICQQEKAPKRVFVEISHDRSKETAAVFVSHSWKTSIHADLSGRPRFLEAAHG